MMREFKIHKDGSLGYLNFIIIFQAKAANSINEKHGKPLQKYGIFYGIHFFVRV
jgi:hypothetical protein